MIKGKITRVKSSIKNLIFAVTGQFFGLLVSFIARIIFIQELGTEYLGLNSLFTNVLSVLSLVELGIGPAIIYSLYKPIAENDVEKIKSLMALFKKAYISIGIIILTLGIGLIPFMDIFFDSMPKGIEYINIIFILFILNASISYFFSYKRSLIIADQKRYIATIYRYSFFISLNILQIIILYITQNYILFLLCQIAATLTENIVVSKVANNLYPYLKNKDIKNLDKLSLNQICKNVKAMVLHKLGGVAVNSTDSLFLSKYVGLHGLGLYSNYQLIINALNIVTSQFFTSISASVGNLGVTETNQKKMTVFNNVLFLNFWIFGLISTILMVLINPFIEAWLGNNYVLSKLTVTILIINFYFMGMRNSILTFRDALGLYWYERYKPIFESIVKLIASYILVQEFGMIGVFLGTTISTITVCFWFEPFILYKYGFNSPVRSYFIKYIKYLILVIISVILALSFASLFREVTFTNLLINLMICIVVFNSIILLFCYRSAEFRYLINLIRRLLKRQ